MTMTSNYGTALRNLLPPGKAFEALDVPTTLAAQPISTYSTGGVGAYGIAFGGGSIWVGGPSGDVVQLSLTGTVLATIARAGTPEGVVWDGSKIWAVLSSSNSIVPYVNGSWGTPVAVGNSPIFACTDNLGNIWVTNNADGTVSVVNIAAQAVTMTITVGTTPYGICSDSYGNIWVANLGSNTVTKIQASTGTVLGTFATGNEPYGVCFDGAYVWVTNFLDNTVSALVSSSGTIAATFSVGTGPKGVLFDGVSIWTANNGSGNVTQLLACNGAFVQAITAAASPISLCFDGTNVWATNSGASSVTAMVGGGSAFIGISNFAALLNGLSRTYDRWKVFADELLQEFVPTTTQMMLPDWEAAFGLPGTNPTPPTTIAGRQKALAAKENGYQTVTAAYVKTIALALGYTIRIFQVAFPQCFCNSSCNQILYTDPWQFVWVVDYTPGSLDGTLQWTINNIVPAHTLVVYNPNQKPATFQAVIRSLAISSGIIASYLLNEGSGSPGDTSGWNYNLTLSGSPLPIWATNGSYGPALNFGTSHSNTGIARSASVSGWQLPVSFFVSFNAPSTSPAGPFVLLNVGSGNIYVGYSSGNIIGQGSAASVTGPAAASGVQNMVVVTISAAGTMTIYLNTSTNTASGSVGTGAPSGPITVGNLNNGSASSAAVIDLAVVWNNRLLAAADVATLFANPFAMEMGR